MINQQTLRKLIIVKNKGKINRIHQIHTIILKNYKASYINNNFDEDNFFNQININLFFGFMLKCGCKLLIIL